MSRSNARRGLGLLIELAVVFIGVLIALAADSWVGEREDQARVRGYVLALRGDLAQARLSLEEQLELNAVDLEQAQYADSLVRGLVEAGETARVGGISWRGMPVVPMGTFEALLATGDINLLDDSLRTALVAGHAALRPHVATLERLYELGAVNVREHLFTLARLRVTERLEPGPIPSEVARRVPEVRATFLLHAGMLMNRRDALSGLHDIVRSMEIRLADDP